MYIFLKIFLQLFLIYFLLLNNIVYSKNAKVYRFSKQSFKKISPTVSAVLVECPKKSLAPQCEQKIMVKVRVSPSANIAKVERYLILDEIFDPKKQTRAKLMSPYLINIARGEPILMYPLDFMKAVPCPTCFKNTAPSKIGNENKKINKTLNKKRNLSDKRIQSDKMNVKKVNEKERHDKDLDSNIQFEDQHKKGYSYNNEDKVLIAGGYPNVLLKSSNKKYPYLYKQIFSEQNDNMEINKENIELNGKEHIGFRRDTYEDEIEDIGNVEAKNSAEYMEEDGKLNYISERESSPIEMSGIPHEFLPNPVPYENVIDDPNLNFNDKLNVIDVIDPKNEEKDKVLEYFENEIQNSYIPYDITKNQRANIPAYKKVRKAPKINNKFLQKRSYIMYDDMKIRDIYSEYEDFYKDIENEGEPSFVEKGEFAEKNSKILNTENTSQVKEKIEKLNNNDDEEKKSVDDVWYSVFNMSAPLQFLSTKVRIFRKKNNLWWRIVPSITLTSLSGLYANTNLSILFSSHAEIYKFSKPLILNNHKLLVPNNKDVDPKRIFAVDSRKFHDNKTNENNQIIKKVCKMLKLKDDEFIFRNRKRDDEGIYSIGDFGDFPTTMNIMENCKNNPQHLCLNLLDEEVPAYKITIQLPFVENAIVHEDQHKVRISNVVIDATTRGSIEIVISVINEALITQEFSIGIIDCPLTCGAKNFVKKKLAPHRGYTLSFLLPLQEIKSGTKYYCEVQVHNLARRIVARREIIIQPQARCLCIWHCSCNCITNVASISSSIAICQTTITDDTEERSYLIFLDNITLSWLNVLIVTAVLLTLMFILGFDYYYIVIYRENEFTSSNFNDFIGLIKAILGCCIPKIGRCKYSLLSSNKNYLDSSRARRFFLNTLFFLVLPFIVLCKLFTPSEEDLLILNRSWECSIVQHELDSDYFNDDDDNESTNIFSVDRRLSSGAEIMPKTPIKKFSMSEILFEEYSDEEEEKDANYVLKTLLETRESPNDQCGKEDQNERLNARYDEASELVSDYLTSKVIYRSFYKPIGGVCVPAVTPYSVRGYFVPDSVRGYQFITHLPLRQHWSICEDVSSLTPIIPPLNLSSQAFSCHYNNKIEVLEDTDLSLHPSIKAPCINVIVQNIGLYIENLEIKDKLVENEPLAQNANKEV